MPPSGKRLTDNINTAKALTSEGRTRPNLTRSIPAKEKLSFSFAYFKQYDYFGLDDTSVNWFASLLDRLKDLSGKDIGIMGDYTQRKQYRIHTVDWGQTNIPIQRKDLNSVPSVYRDNETEYPFWQFMLSQSTGRVAGFLDEKSAVFYIVLIDHKHNLQPTLDHGYKVDGTTKLQTKYEIALQIAKKCTHSSFCPLNDNNTLHDDMLNVLFIDTDDKIVIDKLKQKGLSFQDAFREFILNQI